VRSHHGAASARRRRGLAALLVVVVLVLVGVTAARGVARGATVARTESRPRVLGVHPSLVAGRGGVRILVHGTGFAPGSVVTVGGKRAWVLGVRNPDAIFAIAPRDVGTQIVRVATPAGTSASNARSVLHYDTRVLVVGDSLGIDLGWGFTPPLDAASRLGTVVDDAVGSTGLVRPDFYNWPAHLRADLATLRPDVVVTLFGTNDQQPIATSHGYVEPGTSTWNRLYAARVRQIGAIVHGGGAALVWVGLPRMGPQSVLSERYVATVEVIDAHVVGTLRRATFVNAWDLFTTGRGAYTPYVEVGPHAWILGHQQDGTHLTPGGAGVIDAKALDALRHLLGAR
jgi:hypothetical protein